MRDRLIKLLETDVECNKDGHGDCSMCEYKYADDKCAHYLSNIIADFLLANGVIVPPCKVGQIVWFIRNKKEIIATCIEKIILKHGGLYIKLCCNSMYETTCNSVGKTVFLTKEEAVQALAERNAK